ncbi:hypothetical protein [Catenovulum agarivorans]|uniref:hypothetical protein n=1 Tax=Catenovulum agarivorans TaxID=1172192 RepID=UPI0002D400AC|nr:hypothetical protein [Catenovulum agarivorans]
MRILKQAVVVSSFTLCCLFSLFTHAETIIHLDVAEAKDKYHVDLLKFLFRNDSNYKFQPYPQDIAYGRQHTEIDAGNLSVAAFGTSSELEQRVRPIRIPILKGLLGHRIFIIRKGEESRFANINNMQDLLEFKAGQGRTWADTAVLENAGINTITTVKYDNLFYMLDGDRFDYFPRAVHEPFSEVATRPHLNLTVEKNVMLVYPLALYLFVANDNVKLANAIEERFEAAIADGSFDEFFFNHPLIQDVLQSVRIQDRKIIRISNPNMPAKTPLDRKELWFDINNMELVKTNY